MMARASGAQVELASAGIKTRKINFYYISASNFVVKKGIAVMKIYWMENLMSKHGDTSSIFTAAWREHRRVIDGKSINFCVLCVVFGYYFYLDCSRDYDLVYMRCGGRVERENVQIEN